MVTPDDQINVKFNSDAEQEQTTTINVQQALRVTLEFPGATGSSWRLDPFPSFTLLGDQESPSAGAPGGFRTHTYRLKPTGTGQFVLSWRFGRPTQADNPKAQSGLWTRSHLFRLTVVVAGGGHVR
jgi:hypothetical protein